MFPDIGKGGDIKRDLLGVLRGWRFYYLVVNLPDWATNKFQVYQPEGLRKYVQGMEEEGLDLLEVQIILSNLSFTF
jgi:hypothetical protein